MEQFFKILYTRHLNLQYNKLICGKIVQRFYDNNSHAK